MNDAAAEYLGREGFNNPLAPVTPESGTGEGTTAAPNPNEPKLHKQLVQFFKPSELLNYEPPPGHCLVGDMHIQGSALGVLGGPPGVGKSRAMLMLALLAARGQGEWFGLKVNRQFRTLWLQSENGLVRLHRDLKQMPEMDGFDDWIRISAPPLCGLALQDVRFRREVTALVKDFAPQLIMLDPWNQATRDSQERDYIEALSRFREIVAESPENSASLVAHHLRKPKTEDRHKGRSLAYLLSGSNALYGAARSVFIIQPASDDLTDRRVVFTPSKCNDSETVVDRSAWELKNGLFVPVTDFNFEEFDSEGTKREPKVNEGHIRKLFENGRNKMKKSRAAECLEEIADVKRSAAYEALKLEGGRFSHLLLEDPDTGLIGLTSDESEPSTEAM
jgi:hypothetical protein